MARPIINADEHLAALSGRSQACVAAVVRYVGIARPVKVHLYPKDIERITSELRGSGFDVGRGFMVSGVKVVAADSESC